MKTCPVCQAKTFDDADTCYGCLHRFNAPDEEPMFGSQAVLGIREEKTSFTTPTFFIKLVPTNADSGLVTWSCAVELA